MLKQILEDTFHQLKDIQPVGIDGISIEKFRTILDDELTLMSKKIKNESYNFGYYRQKLITKSQDSLREISIPTIRDKIVINYLHAYLKNAFTEEILLIPSIHQMISDAQLHKHKYEYFIKTDIQNFFPSIDHEILLTMLESRINDKQIISLIKKAIKQTTVIAATASDEREKYTNIKGVPQGLSISGLLADLYLVNLIKKYQNNKNIKFYKFVDDVLIFCNYENLEQTKAELINDFSELKLNIHPFQDYSKSIVGSSSEKFDFLGYTFYGATTSVRSKSTQKMFVNLSKLFTKYKHGRYVNNEIFYQNLNLKITGCKCQDKQYGWIYFFSFMNDYTLLHQLDIFVKINCKKLDIPYNEKIKKFSRAIFEVNNNESNYIVDITSFENKERNRLIYGLEKDVDFY